MQTKIQSLIESWANISIGYGVALASQILVFPLFGIHVDLKKNIGIGIIFTGISLARSYTIRRIFNKLHRENNGI
jgi:hypothetical protein